MWHSSLKTHPNNKDLRSNGRSGILNASSFLLFLLTASKMDCCWDCNWEMTPLMSSALNGSPGFLATSSKNFSNLTGCLFVMCGVCSALIGGGQWSEMQFRSMTSHQLSKTNSGTPLLSLSDRVLLEMLLGPASSQEHFEANGVVTDQIPFHVLEQL